MNDIINYKNMRKSRGVTLVELLITVAIMTILTVVCITGYSSIISADRKDSVVSDFRAILEQARMEAVKQNRSVYVLADTGCGDGETTVGWHDGIVVWVEKTVPDNAACTKNEDEVVREETNWGGNVTIEPLNSAPLQLVFNSRGELDGSDSIYSYRACSRGDEVTDCISFSISPLGRIVLD